MGKKVWQNQDQRGSLKKTEWDSNRLTNYRPLQAPLSWEDANDSEKYTLFGGKKSNENGPDNRNSIPRQRCNRQNKSTESYGGLS
jgi:hypothetical protein